MAQVTNNTFHDRLHFISLKIAIDDGFYVGLGKELSCMGS